MSHKQFEETKYHVFPGRKAPDILANQVWYDLRQRRKLPCLGLKATRPNIKATKLLHCWAEWPPKNPKEWTFNFLNGKTTTRSLAAHGESSFMNVWPLQHFIFIQNLTQDLKDACLFLFCFNGKLRTQGTVLLLSLELSLPCPPRPAASWAFLARQKHSPIPRMPRNHQA